MPNSIHSAAVQLMSYYKRSSFSQIANFSINNHVMHMQIVLCSLQQLSCKTLLSTWFCSINQNCSNLKTSCHCFNSRGYFSCHFFMMRIWYWSPGKIFMMGSSELENVLSFLVDDCKLFVYFYLSVCSQSCKLPEMPVGNVTRCIV